MKRLNIIAIVGLIFCAVQVDQVQAQTYSLGDHVWYDQDQDGVQDTNEPGYNGITVDLYENATCAGIPIASTTSGASGGDGFYQFTALASGSYCLRFANIPAGWNISPADQSADDALDSDADGSAQIKNIYISSDDSTNDMGVYVSGSVGDSVVCDNSSNGLANITVSLFEDFDYDGVADGPTIATTETDATGFYLFTGLEVALADDTIKTTAYILQVDDLDSDLGSCNILPSSNEFNPLLDSDSPDDLNNDFMFLTAYDYCETEGKPINLTFKYTGGGCAASNNSQVPGKFLCSGTIDSNYPINITTTDTDYAITPTFLYLGDTFTVTNSLGGSLYSDANFDLTNSGGTESLTIHTSCSQPLVYGDVFGSLTLVGYIGEAAILGDFVWNDLNQDGIQDAGEPGIEGVSVYLFYAGTDDTCWTVDDTPLAMTVTDANGSYQFKVPSPEKYYCLEFEAPSGVFFSPFDQGADDAKDSDANSSGQIESAIYLLPSEINLTADAGLYFDSDNDGIPDGSDPSIVADYVNGLNPDDGYFGDEGGGQQTAIDSLCSDIEQKILEGDCDEAVKKLKNLRKHLDGCLDVSGSPDKNDWIIDCATQVQVRQLLDILIGNLEAYCPF